MRMISRLLMVLAALMPGIASAAAPAIPPPSLKPLNNALTTANAAIAANALYANPWHDRLEKIRRAASKAYAYNPEDAPIASGVTLSQSGTAPTGLVATTGVAALAAGKIGYSGGHPVTVYTTHLAFPVANDAPATGNMNGVTTPNTWAAWGWEACTATEAAKIVFVSNAGANALSGFLFSVNGQLVSRTPLTPTTNGINYFSLDFGGVRSLRQICILGSEQTTLAAIYVDALSNLSAGGNTGPDKIVALATGDSYSEGQGATVPGQGAWIKKLGRMMGWTDVRQVAVGQTGYLQAGTRKTIRNQLSDWFAVNSDLNPANVDVVTLYSGYNDYTFVPSLVQAEALADMQLIRTLCPNALVIVGGAWAGKRGPDATTLAIEAAVQAAFVAWGDRRAIYTPVSADVGPWQFGTGYSGATNGTGNSDFDVASDATHPNDAGHDMIARRAAAAIRAALPGVATQ